MAVELTAEQIIERKAKDAERKRDERKRAREQKQRLAAEKKLTEAKGWLPYWEGNRANLTEAQRAEYEQRESLVLDTQYIMTLFLENRYEDVAGQLGFTSEDRVSLQDIADEVREEVVAHGVCESIVLVVPRLWTDEGQDLIECASKNPATGTLIKYGYRIALDGLLVERFRQFAQPRSVVKS